MRLLAPLLFLALIGAAPASNARVGSIAPVVSVTSIDGTLPHAEYTPGRVTVLNFWATWCPPCRAETPDLVAAFAQQRSSSVAFLGIDTTETAPIVKTFMSAKGIAYPVALADARAYNAFGIAYIPTTIVLDAKGVVRARWVGGVSAGRLAQYIVDARAGRSSRYVSPAQAQIDALLAPQRFRFAGDATAREAALRAMTRAIANSSEIAKRSDAVDFERLQHEQGELERAAGSAMRRNAKTDTQKVAALRMMARAYGDLNRWAGAAKSDRAALAIMPNTPELVGALTRAYYRLHDYPAMIEQARRYTQLRPGDDSGWSDLGLGYERTRRFREAAPAYERSLTLLKAAGTTRPSQDALAAVADTSLDAADVYVSLGDVAGTRRALRQANDFGRRLAATGAYASLKRNIAERTQEALIAVSIAGRSTNAMVSVVPWTGPDLPGSLASTLKYRLIVAAPADANVTLRARGLRANWVASFCADGLCSPQTVSLKLPAAGVKTYEFQLIPPRDGAAPGDISIATGSGKPVPVPPAGNHAAH